LEAWFAEVDTQVPDHVAHNADRLSDTHEVWGMPLQWCDITYTLRDAGDVLGRIRSPKPLSKVRFLGPSPINYKENIMEKGSKKPTPGGPRTGGTLDSKKDNKGF